MDPAELAFAEAAQLAVDEAATAEETRENSGRTESQHCQADFSICETNSIIFPRFSRGTRFHAFSEVVRYCRSRLLLPPSFLLSVLRLPDAAHGIATGVRFVSPCHSYRHCQCTKSLNLRFSLAPRRHRVTAFCTACCPPCVRQFACQGAALQREKWLAAGIKELSKEQVGFANVT